MTESKGLRRAEHFGNTKRFPKLMTQLALVSGYAVKTEQQQECLYSAR